MLNYISAELYKLRHKKSIFAAVAALLVLEGALFAPCFWVDEAFTQESLMGFLVAMLPVGLFLAPVFAVAVFDDQHGHSTLKNEVVFGVPRSRIYLGKLLTGMLAGTLAAAAVVGWFLLLCVMVMGEPMGPAQWALYLDCIASAYLTWLAALAFAMFLLFTLNSTSGAMVIAYLLAFVGVPVGMIGAGEGAAAWVRLSVNLFYSAPYKKFWYAVGLDVNNTLPAGWGALPYAVLVCVLWVGVFTALGLLRFHRREIK